MNDQIPTSAQRAEALQGMGCKRKRVEDVRFVQGKGNYVDDLKLPGMLYGDFMRSPHAHARIKKIDTAKAAAVPGVVAVLTAETLKTVNLAWMPTLAGDMQMVLADGKVLFQNQEVAFVIAEERYVAADAADLVGGRIRGAVGQRRSAQGNGTGRAGHPRGHQGQDRRRARQAQALQPCL
jgi:aerobic carbon-monoxide dehydrogenase large subunit